MRRPWKRKPQPRAEPWDGRVAVVGMGLQCETCGAPVDAAQCVKTEPGAAWVRVDPCGHVVSMPYEWADK